MVLDQVEPKPVPESTIYTALTPPASTTLDDLEDHNSPPSYFTRFNSSSVPWPGSTFIISSSSSGHAIALRNGHVVLAPPGGRDSIHWECVETKGWLGFKNPVSGKFLGHNIWGNLICNGESHQGWENFCVRMRPEGDYVICMTHYERLWPLGVREERGEKMLAKVDSGISEGMGWKFVKV